MSDIVINNVTRTVTISSVGIQGPRGLTGDVTPEVIAAREAAEAAAQSAHDDAVQTALDRIATADDRQATGEDRTATASDRQAAADSAAASKASEENAAASAEGLAEAVAATAADRAATHADAGQTAEDRVATAADRVATGEDRQAAAASAATAVAATLIGYGVSIYHANGIEVGEYYAERRATVPSNQTSIYAEIINGDAGSEATVTLMVAGVVAHGPFVVTAGAPVSLDGLSISISAADDISFAVSPTPDAVRELYIKTYGAVA